jgi:tetratricopeptide (TPR) repeat protein
LYGYIYQLQNKEEDALSVWKDGSEMLLNTQPERNYRARVWLAIIYASMQDYDSALREASIIESANSTNGYLLYRLTNVYSELGLFEQALFSLEKAINSGFTSVQLMRREELVYMKKISNHPKYRSLASDLESNVDQLRKKFQVYIT